MGDNSKSNGSKRALRRPPLLESLKEMGADTSRSFKNDLLKDGSKDILRQIFGTEVASPHVSGELSPNNEVSIDKVLSPNYEKEQQLEAQLNLERQLREEERALFENKSNELKLALKAVMNEMQMIASATPKLAQEIQIAAIQAPVNPGIYHVFFFEKLLEYLKGFRKRIEDTSSWLGTLNRRAEKKGFWSQYKKHGGRRLLSAEDYSQRSAG